MTTQESQQSISYIFAEHLDELKASAISSAIAALNFWSFEGNDENELDQVFSRLKLEPEHNNNGTLSGKSQQELANILYCGGWVFEGHLGTSVKLNKPRVGDDGKTIKYESVRGSGNQQLFVPHISVRASRAIAKNLQGLITDKNLNKWLGRLEELAPEANDLDFWDWATVIKYPIIITEGAKKACALISAGHPAIALNGVWGWGSNVKDENGETETDEKGFKVKNFHPELIPFLNGREIVLAFDRDEKEETIAKVDKAKTGFAWKLIKEIKKGTRVTELTWDSGYKGIDDFLAAKGEVGLKEAYANRFEVVKSKVTKKAKTNEDKPSDSSSDSSIESQFTSLIEGGLVKVSFEKDGKEKPETIGNHLQPIGYVNNPEQDGASLLLEFKTIRGHISRWTMPRADLAGDGTAIVAGLLSRDYDFRRNQKSTLLDYLHGLGSRIEATYTVTDSSGWVGKSFVLPHKTHGDETLRFRDVDPSPEAITELKGTLDGWKDTVAARCAGNSRLILALGTSFASPLLPIIDIESGGFHLVGATSQGKTTILSVAASVTGIKDIPHWRTTTNGLESIATAFNHLCLPLDEIGQADPKDVGNIAYMLANGQGKARMTKNITNRKPKTWRLMVLSSGEVGLGSYMAQANITQKGGQEVRLPDVPNT
jgi:putative DNA primase/helicase